MSTKIRSRSGVRLTGEVSLMVALMLGIAACSSSDATDSTSTPTTTDGAPAASGGLCAGTQIVFFPGGTAGGGFETVVYNGAVAAADALGADVTYVWSDWDPQNMITGFQQAMATNPDGIAIMGHPGDSAFDPLIDQAESQGILVTVMNTELPIAEAKYAADGMGYVGAVLHDAGASLANEAIKRANLQAGDEVFVWGLKAQPGRGERTQGIIDALEAAGMTVDYLEIDDATNADPAAGVSTFTGFMSSHPNVTAIFIDHGNLTSTIPTYMKAANLEPGSIYAAGFDLSPATIQGIQDGYVNLAIDQQQFLQGFFAIEQLCLSHNYGFSGLFINTGGGFVDQSNIDVIAPLVTEQIR